MTTPSNLRELTAAERAFLDRVRGRRQRLAVGFCVGLLATGLLVLWNQLRDAATGRYDAGILAIVLGVPGAFFALFFPLVSRSPWRLKGGRYARVGLLRGRFYMAGKPSAEFIGEYEVARPTAIALPYDQVVEVEVCPCLEDYPKRHQARVVLSSADGRVTVDRLVRAGQWPRIHGSV
jgi:hypothetical protein